MAEHNLIITWLNDAYGMEQSQIEMLERFIKDYDAYPQIRARLEEHLEETRMQVQLVRSCIESLGGKASATKSFMGKMMGAAQGISTGPYKDEVVKNMLILHAGEHFEHASYLAIAYAAQMHEYDEVADVCLRISNEEKRMADWTESQIPEVIRATLLKAEREHAGR